MSVTYHKYTKSNIRAWLESGTPNGLSELVISKTRAYALIYNPYVTDESVLVVSAMDGDQLVGFVAAFPDYLARPECRCVVGTTLYVLPEYTGDFIGLELVKTIKECYSEHLLIGSDETKSAALIDKLLGNKIDTFPRSRFEMNRTIHVHSLRSLGSAILEPFRRLRMRVNIRRSIASVTPNIRLEYLSMIDNEAYRFIVAHSPHDAFLRSQQSLNWTLRYPFSVTAPLQQHLNTQNQFGAQISESMNMAVKVYDTDQLIGVYVLAKRRADAKMLMLYVDDAHAEQVYATIVAHIHLWQPHHFFSQYAGLNAYMNQHHLSLHHYIDKYFYTHPASLPCTPAQQLQGADGDMFA